MANRGRCVASLDHALQRMNVASATRSSMVLLTTCEYRLTDCSNSERQEDWLVRELKRCGGAFRDVLRSIAHEREIWDMLRG